MKTKKIIIFFILLLLYSCNKPVNQEDKNWIKITERVQYQEQNHRFYIKSGKHIIQLDKENLPLKKVIILNTSLLGYVLELNQENKVIGISGTRYIYSEKIKKLLQQKKIQSVGTDQKYNIEKIIALKPDAVLTHYVATLENTYEILKRNGVKIIFLDEYLEQNPLEKSAYLKLFGVLFGMEDKAEKIYSEIEENYNQLKGIAQKSTKYPKILVNEIYGNHWFIAGGKTFVANYLKDSHTDYILKENQDAKSIPMSFEEVFVRSKNALFWVNVGNYKTKKKLLAINPNYEKLDAFQKGKIFNITKRQKGNANDFFESGSVRSDWVLRDYIKIFHPELLPKDTLFYMKELN